MRSRRVLFVISLMFLLFYIGDRSGVKMPGWSKKIVKDSSYEYSKENTHNCHDRHRARPAGHRLSVLQRATIEDVRTEPFPHIIIKDALPEPIYTSLERHFFSDFEIVAETTGSLTQKMRSNYRYAVKADALLGLKQSRIKKVQPIIREFARYHTSAEFVKEVLWLFQMKLEDYRPDLLQKLQNNSMIISAGPEKTNSKNLFRTDMEMVINSPVFDSPSSVRGYHHDKLNEIYAGLLYMRKKEDKTPGGDFQILRCKRECRKVPDNEEIKKKLGIAPVGRHEQYDPKTLQLDSEVKYGRNTLAMFINSPVSVHAVSSRPITKFSRRYINLNADFRTKASEIVKEENCFRSGEGFSCRPNNDVSEINMNSNMLNFYEGNEC